MSQNPACPASNASEQIIRRSESKCVPDCQVFRVVHLLEARSVALWCFGESNGYSIVFCSDVCAAWCSPWGRSAGAGRRTSADNERGQIAIQSIKIQTRCKLLIVHRPIALAFQCQGNSISNRSAVTSWEIICSGRSVSQICRPMPLSFAVVPSRIAKVPHPAGVYVINAVKHRNWRQAQIWPLQPAVPGPLWPERGHDKPRSAHRASAPKAVPRCGSVRPRAGNADETRTRSAD